MTTYEGKARIIPALIALLLFAPALASFAIRLAGILTFADWWQAAMDPDLTSYAEILVHDSILPRLAVAVLAGSALGLAGTIFQQVLRTPIADPSTLGVSAGAYLALAIATVVAPGLLVLAREFIAFSGAIGAFAIVFMIAWPHRLSPISLVLAGLVVTMICGSIAAALGLFRDSGLSALFIWGSGSLGQNDWSAVIYLAPRLAICAIIAVLLARPLAILSLPDDSARSLGLSTYATRGVSILIATILTASTVSAVGIIGFIGLAAPLIARATGARRLPSRMLWSMVIGAGLLLIADEAVQQLALLVREVPAGAATALLGAPLILLFLRRLPANELQLQTSAVSFNARPSATLFGAMILLLLAIWLSLSLGPTLHGWHFSSPGEAQALLIWRLPRLAGAAAGGILFALSGTIIQRMTGNPMASPEVIGVSSGAALGILLITLFAAAASPTSQLLAAGSGAVVSLFLVLAIGRLADFRPDQVLLIGVAVNTVFAALITLLLGLGLPRMYGLVQWMAGSTYSITPVQAEIAVAAAAIGLAVTPFFARWLAMLPLGSGLASALGVNLNLSRAALLILCAIMAAVATLLIGPLSFVGMMAPHMARALGFHRALPQLFAAAIVAPLIMTFADFIGRVALFPNQMPVGVIATIIGGPYFLYLMRKRAA